MSTERTARITPPEGVEVSFEIATLGARFGAQFLDILVTFGSLLVVFLLLDWLQALDGSVLVTLYFLTTFLIRVPYYIFAELVWNGRTVGKKLTKIRVISADGRRLTAHQIVARNLMKEVEVFLPIATLFAGELGSVWVAVALLAWTFGILLVPAISKQNQRMGDMMAGTLVVTQPKLVLLPDLAVQTKHSATGFVFDAKQLEVYGRYELQVLEEILRTRPISPEAVRRVQDVTRTIARKIGYTQRLLPNDNWQFLNDFYRQQREFLENRHLFGETRENKFHGTGAEKDARAPTRRQK